MALEACRLDFCDMYYFEAQSSCPSSPRLSVFELHFTYENVIFASFNASQSFGLGFIGSMLVSIKLSKMITVFHLCCRGLMLNFGFDWELIWTKGCSVGVILAPGMIWIPSSTISSSCDKYSNYFYEEMVTF